MHFTYINELEQLHDIIDDIIPDEEVFFNEIDIIDFVESTLMLMDIYINENPTAISEPDFYEIFNESIKEMVFIQFEEQINTNENIEDDLIDVLEDIINIYFESFYQGRSENTSNNIDSNSNIDTNSNIDSNSNPNNNELNILDKQENNNFNFEIQEKINYLRSIPQPVQRTEEWYIFRHNLITASNAYKAFESQSTVNQLIYEKCQPLKTNDSKFSNVNVNSTFLLYPMSFNK
jgi:hypothetical protein